MSSLLDHYPYVNNLQTRTQALGLALYGNSVHYLSTAGPGTACKSVWSSLVSPRNTLDCRPWGYDLTGAADLQTAYQSLPNSNFQHMVTLVKQPNFLTCVAPQAAHFFDELEIDHVQAQQQLLEKRMPDIVTRFIAYINAYTDVPVIAPWGKPLWESGVQQGGIQQLQTFGDCLGAWLVDEEFDWLGLVQTLLKHGDLCFPTQPSSPKQPPISAKAQQIPFLPLDNRPMTTHLQGANPR